MSHKLCIKIYSQKLGQGALSNFLFLSIISCNYNILSFMKERLKLYNYSILLSNIKGPSQQRATLFIMGRPQKFLARKGCLSWWIRAKFKYQLLRNGLYATDFDPKLFAIHSIIQHARNSAAISPHSEKLEIYLSNLTNYYFITHLYHIQARDERIILRYEEYTRA